MDLNTKVAILKYVHDLDPNHDVVELLPTADYSGGTIRFSSSITQHRTEEMLKGEKYVEAYLTVKLVKELGYSIEVVELQKEYPVGHPKVDRPRVDILVNQMEDGKFQRRFFFIETKDPEKFEAERERAIQHQLYALADHERTNNLQYLVYYTIEYDNDKLVEKADIIDFTLYPEYEAWDQAGRLTLDLLPQDYGKARKSVFVNKDTNALAEGEKGLTTTAGPSTFAALRKDPHDVLWGGGGMFYNEIFSNLVKIFLAKIYDEETTPEGASYRFQIEMLDDKPEPPTSVFERINKLFQEAQKNYLGYTDAQIRKYKGIDAEKISENKVAFVVERLQGISLIENKSRADIDVLGEFFEGIVEGGFKQSKGQFFTHINLVRFLI